MRFMFWRVWLVSVVMLAAGCGDSASTITGSGDGQGAGAGADVAGGADAGADVPVDCVNGVSFAEVIASSTSSLEEMRSQLPVMKELHLDTVVVWDQFGIQPDHLMVDGTPRMLVRLDDAAGRCDQILEAVARPDLVLFVDWTEQDLSTSIDRGVLPPWRQLVEADIGFDPGSTIDPVWTSIGTGLYGVTSVALRADQEQLAATLLDRYGELIELSVGNFAYPPNRVASEAGSLCETVPAGSQPTDITVEAITLRGDAETGQVEVVVFNESTRTVHLVPNRIAELTKPGSTELVTAFTGAMSAEDRGSLRLDPGAEVTITAAASTAPCDMELGYSLPVGTYEFVLPIHVFDSPASENNVSDQLLLPRLEVELG